MCVCVRALDLILPIFIGSPDSRTKHTNPTQVVNNRIVSWRGDPREQSIADDVHCTCVCCMLIFVVPLCSLIRFPQTKERTGAVALTARECHAAENKNADTE